MLNAQSITAIYSILNIENGKMYIGLSKNPLERWQNHKRLSKQSICKQAIHHAMKKHGIDKFQFSVLQWLSDKNDALNAEKYWISFFQTFNTGLGYNSTAGGEQGAFLCAASKLKIKHAWIVIREKSQILLANLAAEYACELQITNGFDEPRFVDGKWNKNKGSSNPFSKLNEQKVRLIRKFADQGVLWAHLAAFFNVSEHTIKGVVKRYSWAHVS